MKVLYEQYIRRHRSGSNQSSNNNNNHAVSICHPIVDSDSLSARPPIAHIISHESLLINKELGVGEFGLVQQGVWTNGKGQCIQVAIKCLSEERLENNRTEFLKEAALMHSISNEHIVTLYGIVLEPSIMLITELAPLRSLLECLKEPNLTSHFPVSSLCTFASQIADGMAYLETRRLIHRDLAARNVLVFAKNKVKISDFGLSRALGVGKDYYQSNFNVNLKLPIAWCAPECINFLKFTSQSDVWAYGVTLWEMFSYGFQPWIALTGQQILEAIDAPNHQRLAKPECCPVEFYSLMLKCWRHEPDTRPKFSEIVSMLPDCKPVLLQAIRNSNHGNQKELLSYTTGDIVTVIDKSRGDGAATENGIHPLFWKGVSNDRKTGIFNPSDFVAYLGQNLPSNVCPVSGSSTNSFMTNFLSGGSSSSTGSSNGHHNSHSSGHGASGHNSLASTITSTVLQSSKFIRGFLESKSHHGSNNSSPHGNRKHRLRPEMISKPQEGNHHHLPKNYSAGTSESNSKLPHISHPIASYARNSSVSLNNGNCGEENHEYHEISDEEHFDPASPPFEAIDLGFSFMEEVFRELPHINTDLNNETAESETAINENGINVKNEVLELNLKMIEACNSKKKPSAVKHISEAEQNELESAIAMAKDMLATRTMEDELDLTKNDSPKTPNSPNKRKFSFKFPHTHKSSPKSERRTFSQETESIGNIIESITPAAKEAYLSLVEKGVSPAAQPTNPCSTAKEHLDKRPDVKPPPPPSQPPVTSSVSSTFTHGASEDSNPLRMLRSAGIGQVLRPKVRGNRSFSQPRLPTTAQTAGLARVASSRSQLGSPPPVPSGDGVLCSQQTVAGSLPGSDSSVANCNALPLPPRDRSRPLIQLKTHQRRHPLVIPAELSGSSAQDAAADYGSVHLSEDLTYDSVKHESPPLVHRHVPVLKQVSCPQAPAAFLNVYNNNNKATNNASFALTSFSDCDGASAPLTLQPNSSRTYLTDDLTESLESEMEKAFESIKLGQTAKDDLETNESPEVEQSDSSTVDQSDSACGNSLENTISPAQTNGTVAHSSVKLSVDRDEVRVMQKVLGNEANLDDNECAQILDTTEWDIHKAIKCVRLRQQLRSHNIEVTCDWAQMLTKFNWNLRQASNYLIATRGVPEDTTEV